jgi:hypothetical protein
VEGDAEEASGKRGSGEEEGSGEEAGSVDEAQEGQGDDDPGNESF